MNTFIGFLYFFIIFLLSWYLFIYKNKVLFFIANLFSSIIIYVSLICLNITNYTNTSSDGGFLPHNIFFYLRWLWLNILIFVGFLLIKAFINKDNKKIISIPTIGLLVIINILLVPVSINTLYKQWVSHYINYRFNSWGSSNIPNTIGINYILNGICYEINLRDFMRNNKESYRSLVSVGSDLVNDENIFKRPVYVGAILDKDSGKNFIVYFNNVKKFFYVKQDNEYKLVNVTDLLPKELKVLVLDEYPGNIRIWPGIDMTAKNENEITVVMGSGKNSSVFLKPVIKDGSLLLEEIPQSRINLKYNF